ncbi:MAG: aminotransferase class IV [Dehalococcoidales bacterium]|nr:aminotransferase class IV [Dehalococcoidales bacterium]
MSNVVYLNGALIPRSRAKVSALDYGFLYGLGLFETMRAYEGQVFRLESHLSRLSRSAELLGIPVIISELRDAIRETLEANRLRNARIRVTISAGEGKMPPNPKTCRKPTVLVLAERYQPYPQEVYRRGFRAVISSIRRNSQSPLSGLKSSSYMESLLARQQAGERGGDEAICLNEKGFLAEASMSNIFLVSEGILRTPGEESGILPGITRSVIIELALKLGINVLEEDIRPIELFQAQEAFLTNSLIEVMPLTEIEGKPVASGRPGALSERLLTEYREQVLNG